MAPRTTVDMGWCLRGIHLSNTALASGASSKDVKSGILSGSHQARNMQQIGATYLGQGTPHNGQPTQNWLYKGKRHSKKGWDNLERERERERERGKGNTHLKNERGTAQITKKGPLNCNWKSPVVVKAGNAIFRPPTVGYSWPTIQVNWGLQSKASITLGRTTTIYIFYTRIFYSWK